MTLFPLPIRGNDCRGSTAITAPEGQPTETEASPMRVKFVGNDSILWLPPQSSASGPTAPPTTSPFLTNDIETGRRNTPPSESSEACSTFPSTDEDVRLRFISFLNDKILQLEDEPQRDIQGQCPNPDDAYQSEYKDSRFANRAEEKREYFAILAVALDPTANFRGGALGSWFQMIGGETSLSTAFAKVCSTLKQDVSIIASIWHLSEDDIQEKRVEVPWEKEEEVGGIFFADSKAAFARDARSRATVMRDIRAADIRAQKEVPEWYGGRCMLSGFIKPRGVHIMPAAAVRTAGPEYIWSTLQQFWPLPAMGASGLIGLGATNILPLGADARSLWDRYKFAIRPIQHPTDPLHRIYIQMVWLKGGLCSDAYLDAGLWGDDDDGVEEEEVEDEDDDNGVDEDEDEDDDEAEDDYDEDDDEHCSIPDFRSSDSDGVCPPVKHGDVYEIVTENPETHPLPDFNLLQIQFAVHKMLAMACTKNALETIFSDPLTCDCGDGYRAGGTVPPEWKFLLDAAVDAGVLSTAQANRWGRAFIRRNDMEARL